MSCHLLPPMVYLGGKLKSEADWQLEHKHSSICSVTVTSYYLSYCAKHLLLKNFSFPIVVWFNSMMQFMKYRNLPRELASLLVFSDAKWSTTASLCAFSETLSSRSQLTWPWSSVLISTFTFFDLASLPSIYQILLLEPANWLAVKEGHLLYLKVYFYLEGRFLQLE